MIQFNLGLLLKETGDMAGAQKAFFLALQQRPDFTPASIALQQTTRDSGLPSAANALRPSN